MSDDTQVEQVAVEALLTEGTGRPPTDWNADEAAERVRVQSHGRPEHLWWLQMKDDKGRLVNTCGYCDDK